MRQRELIPDGQTGTAHTMAAALACMCILLPPKKPFGDVLRDEIFLPAGMKNTFVYSGPASIPANAAPPCNNAVGYEKENGSWVARWGFPPGHPQQDHLEVGDGGIWSNLEDMAKWDTALRTNKLIKPASMKLALTGSRKDKGYGLGGASTTTMTGHCTATATTAIGKASTRCITTT
jgi:CubicO group peptidase (beta-lactamase class C family)